MELMLVIGIIGVLAAVVGPMITDNIPRFQLKGAARLLLADFQKAKVEAVKRNCNVQMLFSTGTYSAEGEVGSYQIIETDGNTVLLTRPMPKYVTLYTSSFTGTPGYTPQGLPLNSLQGSVYMVNSKGTSYSLSLSAAGHVTMSMSDVDLNNLTAW